MISPAEFATNIFYLDGAPLKMPAETMRHLYPIYNKKSNSLLFKFGRQTHKSTTISFKITLPCLKYENFHSLYVAPTGNQVSVFSTGRLDSATKGSPIISDHYFNTKTKDQISYKEFMNGSKIYLRSAFHTADAIRGISADQICVDEIQDVLSDNLPVVFQAASHSLAKYEHLKERFPNLPSHIFNSKILAGTPKTSENTMETYWGKSSQTEWIIHCKHCNKYNYINENNIGLTCLICNKCGKPIFYNDGQWVSMNNNSDAFIDGYRLPQIVLPWVNNIKNPEVWKINVVNPRSIYTVEKFNNEVLALSYANAKHPVSTQEIIACCKPYKMIPEDVGESDSMLKGQKIITAGVDWGKGDDILGKGVSYSVLSIGAFVKGRFKTVFMKRYTGRMSDAIWQVGDMLKIIRKFGAKLVIADTGDGRTSNAMMVEALGAMRFAELYEHGSQSRKIKWDKIKGHYIINRTQVMVDCFMEIKRDMVDFFEYEQFKEFSGDITCIFSEYSDRLRSQRFDHSSHADDAFHAWMFSRIACGILCGNYNQYLNGGANEE